MYKKKVEFLKKLLGSCRYSESTKEAEFHCCFCKHHNKKLSINISTDRWQCWVCGKAGKNLVYLLRKVGDQKDIEKYLKDYKKAYVGNVDVHSLTYTCRLPSEYRPLIHCLQERGAALAYRYLLGRGLTEDDILFHKIGFILEGDYRNRVIFPSFDAKGELNFFAARSFVEGAYFKYIGPLDAPKNYGSQVIFNELNVDFSKPVTITEGFTDVYKTDGNAVPLLGSYLNTESKLFYHIVESGTSIILALDPDAKRKFFKIAHDFMSYGNPIYSIDFGNYEDLGKMSKEEYSKRKQNMKMLDETEILREKLRQAC